MSDILRRPGRSSAGPLVALAAAAGLALAGCGTNPAVTPDAEPAPVTEGQMPEDQVTDGQVTDGTADPQAVSWTGEVCQALVPVAQTLRIPPTIDVTAPQAAQQAYRDYLATAQTQAEQAQQQLEQLGAPPIEGGEDLAEDVREQLDDLRDDVADAQQRIDAADPGNPLSIGEAVVAGGNLLGAVGNNVQAIGALTDEPELRIAFEEAPACADLRMVGETA
jgi:hypothetical protein